LMEMRGSSPVFGNRQTTKREEDPREEDSSDVAPDATVVDSAGAP
jgi:hypothetical protein